MVKVQIATVELGIVNPEDEKVTVFCGVEEDFVKMVGDEKALEFVEKIQAAAVEVLASLAKEDVEGA